MMKSIFKTALLLLVTLTVLTGVIYPLAVTGIAQSVFPQQANGSVIESNGHRYGSSLLAQVFTPEQDQEGKFLWGRIMNPSAFAVKGTDGTDLLYSGPSNLSPASEDYRKLVADRVKVLHEADPAQVGKPIPVDLVTCSGSGLDPHISPAAAEYQVERIAARRGMAVADVRRIIDAHTTGKWLGLFGEDAVNVLEVNLALEQKL